jgi:hypothetical protein
MVSPLDFIKEFSGQDPSLTKRTVGGAQALADLQRSLGKQSLSNIGSANTTAMGQGFSNAAAMGQAGGAGGELAAIRQSAQNLVRAKTLQSLSPGGLYAKLQPGGNVRDVLDPSNPLIGAAPPNVAAAYVTGKAAAEIDKSGTERRHQNLYAFDDKGIRRKITPAIDVVDVKETESFTRKRGTGGMPGRFPGRVTTPSDVTPEAPTDADTKDVDIFKASLGELAAQGYKRGYIKEGRPDAGDWVVTRQVGNRTQVIARKKKGTFRRGAF